MLKSLRHVLAHVLDTYDGRPVLLRKANGQFVQAFQCLTCGRLAMARPLTADEALRLVRRNPRYGPFFDWEMMDLAHGSPPQDFDPDPGADPDADPRFGPR